MRTVISPPFSGVTQMPPVGVSQPGAAGPMTPTDGPRMPSISVASVLAFGEAGRHRLIHCRPQVLGKPLGRSGTSRLGASATTSVDEIM